MNKREFSALQRGDDGLGIATQRIRETRGWFFWSTGCIRSEREPGFEHGLVAESKKEQLTRITLQCHTASRRELDKPPSSLHR